MTFSDLETDMRAWRHHLHQNPEFGFEEIKTADFVAEKLSDFGIKDIQTSIGNTGVVATLKLGQAKKQIALRADMDCLRIHETTNLPYASKAQASCTPADMMGIQRFCLGRLPCLPKRAVLMGQFILYFNLPRNGGRG